MHVNSSIPKPTAGRTFYVAISILGATALAQLVAVAWVFVSRFHAPSPEELAAGAKSGGVDKLNLADPFPIATPAPVSVATPTPAPQQVASLPKPTPVPMRREATPEARINELVEQARALNERGDTSTALIRLREALVIGPDKPQVLAELALTYEKMGLADKAIENWRRVYDMGTSAGIYFAAADAKIKNVEAMAAAAAQPGPAQPAGTPSSATSLSLGEITMINRENVDGGTRFRLKIPMQAQAGTAIDVRDVVIQVFFYDVVGGQNVVRTNADVNYNWLTAPLDWKEDGVEVLEVEYSQLKPDPKAGRAEDRKYYGYVVRIYYKNNLQDRKAEPINLLKQYPPPPTLNEDNK